MAVERRDGKIVAVRRAARKKPLRGKDRRGVRSADLRRDMTDAMARYLSSPMVDKPRVLIETVRIVGEDCLTAQDQALYEALLATARDQGMDAEQHSIPLSDAMRFLDVRHPARVAESLERLTRTVVRYDFRDDERRRYGAMPLVLAEIDEDLRSGAATLTFAIPEPVRQAVLAAVQYTWLEINSFAAFRCRYTSRLYQRLALRAGQDGALNKRWEIEPAELARLLQFPVPDGGLHYATFRRRCLEPAMRDIEERVSRFKADLEEVRGAGRGRPVEMLVFRVTEAQRRIEEVQAARTSMALASYHRRPDPVLSADELPSRLAIGKAVTATRLSEIELSDGWRAAVAKAKADPGADVRGMTGGFLLAELRREGADSAFLMWAGGADAAGTGAEAESHAQGAEAAGAPAAVPEAPPRQSAQTAETAETVPAPAPAAVPERQRRKARAIEDAEGWVDQIDGWCPAPRGQPEMKRTIRSGISTRIVLANFEPDVFPWVWLSTEAFEDECAAVARQLPRAFDVLKKLPEAKARQSARNLWEALAEWDMDRLLRTCKAIAAQGGRLPPPLPPSVLSRGGRGARPGGHVWTEENAGQYHDPHFVAGAGGWDDRAEADFEDALD